MILAAPEMTLLAALATCFTGAKTLSILGRLDRCLAIAAERASTCGSNDMMASVMSSGKTSTTVGTESGTGIKEERWVIGDDVGDREPRERLRSSFSSATGLSCFAPGRLRILRTDPAGVRDSRG